MDKYKDTDGYSKMELTVINNTIFIEDILDGDLIAIHPDVWEHVKSNIDQQIADGYLGSR